jgi:ribose 5-phosphate isomerase RpiB
LALALLERLRVWENAVEGAKSNNASKVIAMGFKMYFSSSAILNLNRFFLVEG